VDERDDFQEVIHMERLRQDRAVHAGHREILQRVVELARERGWKPSVLTFDPHPARIVAPERAPRLLTTPEARALRAAQLQFNLPLLIVGGYFVLQSAREFGADRLLLCARDSCLLEPVVKLIARLTGAPIAIRYIRASRKLFYSVSVEYEVYFRQQLGAKTLLVDLVGGGGSSCHFLKSANLETRVKPAIVVVGELAAESYEGIAVESLVKKASVPVMMAIESLNSSLEGSALSAEIRNFLVEINLAPNEFRPAAQRLISQMHEVAETAIGTINESVSRLPSEIPHEILLQAGNALVALIPEHWQGMQLLLLEHIQNLAH